MAAYILSSFLVTDIINQPTNPPNEKKIILNIVT